MTPIRHATLLFLAIVLAAPAAWGQRNLRDIPDPDPELQRRTFVVPAGFEVNLYASDPQLAKPIHMNFDHRGRLWIASSEVYPHIKPGEPAIDKILVLEDLDGDGRADETRVFADGLLIPTGVLPDHEGVYVANSTELIHLADTTGDGRADRRRVVLSGFGTEDTHHLLHTLRWGPDGALYMNQSIYIHSHVETPHGVRRMNGGGIWRFEPDRLKLDIYALGFVNPWGIHFDRWGQSFATDGAYGEGINYVFPGAVFVTSPGAKRTLQGLNPGSPKHCGLEVVSGRHLPPEWQGNMITNDFRAHRVCRFVVSEAGSGYASRQEQEVIKSTHAAFRPIDAKMGPDGALYIADWYNPIIQHGEVDFRDPRRDKVHGRIWRVTAKGRPLVTPPDFAALPVPELLELLRAPEDWIRLFAKLEMKHRGADAVLPALAAWRRSSPADDPEALAHLRLETLWTYQCLDRVEPELLHQLLADDDHRVRAAAVRVATHWRDRLPPLFPTYAAAVADPHPRVRLEAVRALAEIPTPAAAETAARALDRDMDRFLDFALWRTLRDLSDAWLPALREGRIDFGGRAEHLEFALKAVEAPGVVDPLLQLIAAGKAPADRVDGLLLLVASLGDANHLRRVYDAALAADGPLTVAQRVRLLDGLAEATRRRRVRPAGDLSTIANLYAENEPALQAAAMRAAGVWQVAAHRDRLAAWADHGGAPESVRQAALAALAALGGAENRQLLAELAARGASARRAEAIGALAGLDQPQAIRRAVELLQTPDAGFDPAPLVATLLARQQAAQQFTAALDGAALAPDTARLVVRAVQASSQPTPELLAAVRAAGKLDAAGWKLSPAEQQELAQQALAHGDPVRGEAIYRRGELQCLKCHAIGGAGGVVGPDLSSIGASAPADYLVESLVDPGAKVKENFHAVSLLLDDGRVVSGIPVREGDGELTLRDAEDRLLTVRLDAIEEKSEGRSLMPAGLIDGLTRAELTDLVRFLSELGKVGPYALGQARVARRWEALTWTDEAHRRLNRTSFDTAASDDPALTWGPAYSRVAGELPLDGLATFKPHANLPPTTFLRTAIDVAAAGRVTVRLNSAAAVQVWLDGKPLPATAEFAFDAAAGRYQVVLAVDRDARSEPLRLELIDAASNPAQAQFVTGK